MNVFPKTVLWWVPPPCLLRGASSYYINQPWSKRPPLYQVRNSSWVIWTWYPLVSQAVGRRPYDPASRSTADFPCPSCTKVFRTVSRQLQQWKTRLTVHLPRNRDGNRINTSIRAMVNARVRSRARFPAVAVHSRRLVSSCPQATCEDYSISRISERKFKNSPKHSHWRETIYMQVSRVHQSFWAGALGPVLE